MPQSCCSPLPWPRSEYGLVVAGGVVSKATCSTSIARSPGTCLCRSVVSTFADDAPGPYQNIEARADQPASNINEADTTAVTENNTGASRDTEETAAQRNSSTSELQIHSKALSQVNTIRVPGHAHSCRSRGDPHGTTSTLDKTRKLVTSTKKVTHLASTHTLWCTLSCVDSYWVGTLATSAVP